MAGRSSGAGLHITVAARAEDLLPALFEHLGGPSDDPFEPHIVVVPNQGVSDWVRRRIAAHFGVAANIEFLFPSRFRSAMLGEAEPLDAWAPHQLRWTLLAALQADPDAAPGFRGTDRPLKTAERIADLFDRYAVYRPDMVRQWTAGHDVHRLTADGWEPVPAAYRWQPPLWRTAHDAIGIPSRAEDAAHIASVLAGRAGSLPSRVALFGASTFGGSHAGVVDAMATHARVDVLLLAPAPAAGSSTIHHPLIETWAVPSRETVSALAQQSASARIVSPDISSRPATVLGRLQRAVAVDDATRRPARAASDRAHLLAGGDGSVQIHGCHGAVRQVEVLRDAILHLMIEDPTLTPRDIVVVAPDLKRFAPLIEPVLGAEVGGDPGSEGTYRGAERLPAVVQDRSLSRTSTAAQVLQDLIRTVTGRATTQDVRKLLDHEPVHRAYGLSNDDRETIQQWVDRLGVRWGLDGQHRTENGYSRPLNLGTWSEAIDRLTLGAFIQTPIPREIGAVVPHDDVSDQDLHAIAMLSQFVHDLIELRNLSRGVRTLGAWTDDLAAFADAYRRRIDAHGLEAPDDDVAGAFERMDEVVASMAGHQELELSATELVELIADGVAIPSTRRGALRDAVTVCSTVPLRGVPARVVAILGFDERAVQRPSGDGDDLLSLHRALGEPDRALDERQALLDAVVAAREHLIVTYDAHSPRDNRRIPPPIALDELIDAIADHVEPGSDARLPIVIEHTRQLTHPVNLGADADPSIAGRSVRDLVPHRPWTFEEAAFEAVRVQQRPVAAPRTAALHAGATTDSAGSSGERVFTIDEFVAAFTRTDACYLRDELGVEFPGPSVIDNGRISLWPDALLEANLGRELLAATARGAGAAWLRTRARLGGLPPGAIGDKVLAATVDQVAALRAAIPKNLGSPRTVEIDLRLPNGRETVVLRDRVEVTGTTVLHAEFVKWDATRVVRPLLELASVMLAEPDDEWQAVVVTRPAGSNKNPVCKELTLDDPERFLQFAIELRDAARRGPVAFLPRSTWAWDGSMTARRSALSRDLLDPYCKSLHGDLKVEDLDAQPEFAHWADRLREAARERAS